MFSDKTTQQEDKGLEEDLVGRITRRRRRLMDRQRILEMAVGVFLGNVAFFMFAWVLFALLSRMFGWD